MDSFSTMFVLFAHQLLFLPPFFVRNDVDSRCEFGFQKSYRSLIPVGNYYHEMNLPQGEPKT